MAQPIGGVWARPQPIVAPASPRGGYSNEMESPWSCTPSSTSSVGLRSRLGRAWVTWSGPGHCQALLRLARLGRGASHNALQWIPSCTDGADQRGPSIGIEYLVGSGFSYGHSVTEMWCIAVGWRQASWNVGVNEVQSRVPAPASGACSPGISRAIYVMPIVATLHVSNLEAIVHLQRWQFQDLLVFTAARPPGSQDPAFS